MGVSRGEDNYRRYTTSRENGFCQLTRGGRTRSRTRSSTKMIMSTSLQNQDGTVNVNSGNLSRETRRTSRRRRRHLLRTKRRGVLRRGKSEDGNTRNKGIRRSHRTIRLTLGRKRGNMNSAKNRNQRGYRRRQRKIKLGTKTRRSRNAHRKGYRHQSLSLKRLLFRGSSNRGNSPSEKDFIRSHRVTLHHVTKNVGRNSRTRGTGRQPPRRVKLVLNQTGRQTLFTRGSSYQGSRRRQVPRRSLLRHKSLTTRPRRRLRKYGTRYERSRVGDAFLSLDR